MKKITQLTIMVYELSGFLKWDHMFIHDLPSITYMWTSLAGKLVVSCVYLITVFVLLQVPLKNNKVKLLKFCIRFFIINFQAAELWHTSSDASSEMLES